MITYYECLNDKTDFQSESHLLTELSNVSLFSFAFFTEEFLIILSSIFHCCKQINLRKQKYKFPLQSFPHMDQCVCKMWLTRVSDDYLKRIFLFTKVNDFYQKSLNVLRNLCA